ncbi:MAG: hypothetical protein Q9218_003435 [Villophora microphyllina]
MQWSYPVIEISQPQPQSSNIQVQNTLARWVNQQSSQEPVKDTHSDVIIPANVASLRKRKRDAKKPVSAGSDTELDHMWKSGIPKQLKLLGDLTRMTRPGHTSIVSGGAIQEPIRYSARTQEIDVSTKQHSAQWANQRCSALEQPEEEDSEYESDPEIRAILDA